MIEILTLIVTTVTLAAVIFLAVYVRRLYRENVEHNDIINDLCQKVEDAESAMEEDDPSFFWREGSGGNTRWN